MSNATPSAEAIRQRRLSKRTPSLPSTPHTPLNPLPSAETLKIFRDLDEKLGLPKRFLDTPTNFHNLDKPQPDRLLPCTFGPNLRLSYQLYSSSDKAAKAKKYDARADELWTIRARERRRIESGLPKVDTPTSRSLPPIDGARTHDGTILHPTIQRRLTAMSPLDNLTQTTDTTIDTQRTSQIHNSQSSVASRPRRAATCDTIDPWEKEVRDSYMAALRSELYGRELMADRHVLKGEFNVDELQPGVTSDRSSAASGPSRLNMTRRSSSSKPGLPEAGDEADDESEIDHPQSSTTSAEPSVSTRPTTPRNDPPTTPKSTAARSTGTRTPVPTTPRRPSLHEQSHLQSHAGQPHHTNGAVGPPNSFFRYTTPLPSASKKWQAPSDVMSSPMTPERRRPLGSFSGRRGPLAYMDSSDDTRSRAYPSSASTTSSRHPQASSGSKSTLRYPAPEPPTLLDNFLPSTKENLLRPSLHLASLRAVSSLIPTTCFKVLDAPELQDDFYLNLIDWSQENVLGVGLGEGVYFWNANTSRVGRVGQTERGDFVASVCWVQRGTNLAIGTSKGHITIHSEKSFPLTTLHHESRVGTLTWLESDSILASGSRDRRICLWDVREPDSKPLLKFVAHKQEVCGIKWNPNASQLATGGNDNTLSVWDWRAMRTARTGQGEEIKPLWRFEDHEAAIKAIAWSPHTNGLLCSGGGTADRRIRFFDTLTGQHLHSRDTGSQVCNLVWSPHSKELLSTHGYSQNQICVWSYPSMQQIGTLMGHTHRVLYLALSPDGETVVTGAGGRGDETLRFWTVFKDRKPLEYGKIPTMDTSRPLKRRPMAGRRGPRAFDHDCKPGELVPSLPLSGRLNTLPEDYGRKRNVWSSESEMSSEWPDSDDSFEWDELNDRGKMKVQMRKRKMKQLGHVQRWKIDRRVKSSHPYIGNGLNDSA